MQLFFCDLDPRFNFPYPNVSLLRYAQILSFEYQPVLVLPLTSSKDIRRRPGTVVC